MTWADPFASVVEVAALRWLVESDEAQLITTFDTAASCGSVTLTMIGAASATGPIPLWASPETTTIFSGRF